MPDSALDVDALRAFEFTFAAESAYLNAASITPLPERARRAAQAFNDRRARIHDFPDEEMLVPLHRARDAAARLVGADPGEIALGGNTSYGINLAALALPLAPGSTVVVSDREFPTNVYPWMGRDYRLEVVPTDAQGRPDEPRLLERLGRGDVSAFALSSVQFATGYRADLERFGRLCREQGIFFVVDAIQSLGQLPLDVRAANIDVLAAGGHKWLISPLGTGFVYVRRELLQRMEPRVVGWTAMQATTDLGSMLDYRREFRADARRFEVGTLPIQDFGGFAESLGLLMEVGVDAIRLHLEELLEPLVAWLREHDEVEVISDLRPGARSGIFCFRPPSADVVFRRLAERGVVCALREGAIRVAPHLYNTRADLERVVDILDQSRGRGWS